MNKILKAPRFQTFYLSQEKSHCPQIQDLIKVGKELSKKGLTPNATGNLSVRFGKRVVITSTGSNLGLLSPNDFVEAIDYDFPKNLAFVMGEEQPSSELPMHWLIYNNFRDIQAIIHVHDERVLKWAEGKKNLPLTQRVQPYGTLELALEALKVLKDSKYVILREHGVLSVGKTIEEAYREITNYHQKSI
jgi:L-fuculose-phosphate aldolase